MNLPRYAPERAFPPYAFLPGRDPHPTRDPAGHSYSESPELAAEYLEAGDWKENQDYLFGVDLYNHGFLWEAHEVWEGLWHAAKHDELQAELLQGLIQCSAAALKIRMQQPRGLRKLGAHAIGRLERVVQGGPPSWMGLELPDFLSEFRTFAESGSTDAEERPRLTLAL